MSIDWGYIMILPVLMGALVSAALLIWWERRLLGFWQDRLGPNRVGPFGLLQIVADMVKLFAKDDWVPPFADRALFILAPLIIAGAMLMAFVVVPFGPGLAVADLNVGVLFFLAMTSLAVYGVLLSGLASNNKYSLLGGLRSAAQMVTYEVFMGLSLMGVVLLAMRNTMKPRICGTTNQISCWARTISPRLKEPASSTTPMRDRPMNTS